MVPAHSHKVSRVSWYSGSCSVSQAFVYGAFTLSGRSFQDRSANNQESLMQSEPRHARTSVWALPISLAATFGIILYFLFLRLLRCFSSPGSLPCVMDWRMDDWCCPAGFPHSEICGSSDICSFPQLIAAYHVFLRLLVPRHPPCALIRLTSCYAYL